MLTIFPTPHQPSSYTNKPPQIGGYLLINIQLLINGVIPGVDQILSLGSITFSTSLVMAACCVPAVIVLLVFEVYEGFLCVRVVYVGLVCSQLVGLECPFL